MSLRNCFYIGNKWYHENNKGWKYSDVEKIEDGVSDWIERIGNAFSISNMTDTDVILAWEKKID